MKKLLFLLLIVGNLSAQDMIIGIGDTLEMREKSGFPIPGGTKRIYFILNKTPAVNESWVVDSNGFFTIAIPPVGGGWTDDGDIVRLTSPDSVGIGTASPDSVFHLVGGARLKGNILLEGSLGINQNATGTAFLGIISNTGTDADIYLQAANRNRWWTTADSSSNEYLIGATGVTRPVDSSFPFTIQSNGNINIKGQSAAVKPLEIFANTGSQTAVIVEVFDSAGASNFAIHDSVVIVESKLGIKTTTVFPAEVHIGSNTGTDAELIIQGATGQRWWLATADQSDTILRIGGNGTSLPADNAYAMVINTTQKVGFSEVAPDSLVEVGGSFHVQGNSLFEGRVGIKEVPAAGVELGVGSGTGSDGEFTLQSGIKKKWWMKADDSLDKLLIGADGTSAPSDASYAITIDDAQNVGLSVTSPSGIFHHDGTGEAKGLGKYEEDAHTQTTDATTTAIDTISTATDRGYVVKATFVAIKDDGSQGAGYIIAATFRNDGGVLNQVGSTNTGGLLNEDDAAWAVDFNISGTNIQIRVTGNTSDTVEWQVTYSVSVVTI